MQSGDLEDLLHVGQAAVVFALDPFALPLARLRLDCATLLAQHFPLTIGDDDGDNEQPSLCVLAGFIDVAEELVGQR